MGRINLINGIINGTGTLTTTFDTISVQAGTIRASLADVGTSGNSIPARLVKTTAGTVTLTSANSTYGGVTEIQAGTLIVTSLADRGNASSIGTGTYEDGAIRLGSAGNAGTLQYLAMPMPLRTVCSSWWVPAGQASLITQANMELH
ncbi:autotransporter-associated beta strand repeat-containing protein [Verrucomicrobium spinosum]|uniref:autotransporter-associated beta strand repeat-containing protein n=1 Tax=Verrucomicrobium spinosum TaxID=2736 RepID=UPI00094629D6|nr:autotransporter-associated beta strand repeat-containing protein [Verrucomicrobium spinosum]